MVLFLSLWICMELMLDQFAHNIILGHMDLIYLVLN